MRKIQKGSARVGRCTSRANLTKLHVGAGIKWRMRAAMAGSAHGDRLTHPARKFAFQIAAAACESLGWPRPQFGELGPRWMRTLQVVERLPCEVTHSAGTRAAGEGLGFSDVD